MALVETDRADARRLPQTDGRDRLPSPRTQNGPATESGGRHAEDEVEVRVSLVGAIQEVRLRTKRANAQQLYLGANRITGSATVENRGSVPVIVGEYTIVQ